MEQSRQPRRQALRVQTPQQVQDRLDSLDARLRGWITTSLLVFVAFGMLCTFALFAFWRDTVHEGWEQCVSRFDQRADGRELVLGIAEPFRGDPAVYDPIYERIDEIRPVERLADVCGDEPGFWGLNASV